jgi:hypothetical protein
MPTQFGQTSRLQIWIFGGARPIQNFLSTLRTQEGSTMRYFLGISFFVFADCNAQRWGDAPVHSIAAALFTRKDQIHFFKDIGKLGSCCFVFIIDPFAGYKHAEFAHCPQGKLWREGHCSCDPNDNFGAIYNTL